MRITFNELAERELNDAARYYQHEQPGLGTAFIAEVRRCTEALAEHPESGPIRVSTSAVDLGYALSRRWWRQGLMSEAVMSVVRWALAQPTI